MILTIKKLKKNYIQLSHYVKVSYIQCYSFLIKIKYQHYSLKENNKVQLIILPFHIYFMQLVLSMHT